MLPKPPPREPSLGFIYSPPFRIQGVSIAGEATTIQVPELDVVFDMGSCPRAMLASPLCALSHGHMDHVGGLAYYLSQRQFQGMGTGAIACDARIEGDIRRMLEGYVGLERQRTPYELFPLEDGQSHPLKPNHYLRGFHTEHTAPSMGYVVYEKRTKLKDEFVGLPQEKLVELKKRGEEITRSFEVPLVAYTGDTLPGAHLLRADIREARIVISECTFFEKGHHKRSRIGMHMHVDDIAEWLPLLACETFVIGHISRRTHVGDVRQALAERLSEEDLARVRVLMDHRTNRGVYERQVAATSTGADAASTSDG
ncbi:MAG: MBL fold metallo-hydrolase [Phycisphaerales bacterium]|jgi:ribonuclease Z